MWSILEHLKPAASRRRRHLASAVPPRWLRWALAAMLCGGLAVVFAQVQILNVRPEFAKKYAELTDEAFEKSHLLRNLRSYLEDYPDGVPFEWLYFAPPPMPLAVRTHVLAAPNPAGATSLKSFTPAAAFRGNQTVLVARTAETAIGKGDAVLARATGCALSQYAFPDVTAADKSATLTFTGIEAYLRETAALPAAAPTYPKSCSDRALGIPSSNSAVLGQTSNGDTLIAVTDDKGTLKVSRVSAAGAVVSEQTLATGAALTFAVADLNSDGLADIVVPYWIAPDGTAGVAVFLSQASASYAIPARAYAYGAAAAGAFARVSIEDVDGDGKLDLVAIAGSSIISGRLMTLRGDGSGGFAPSGALDLSNAIGVPFVVADFDGDGRKDVLTSDGLFFAGQGNGSFAAPVQRLDVAPSQPVGSVAVGDFDGDGVLDVALLGSLRGSTGRFVSIFIGRGDATFRVGPTYSTVSGADELTVTDIDGDGVADLWVGKASGGIYSAGLKTNSLMHFLLGTGNGTFAGAPVLAAPGARGLPTLAVADFNGDGKPDIVALPASSRFLSDPSQLQFFAGSASGDFAAPVATANLSFTPTLIARGDFNGDGKIDLVVAGGKLAVLLGQGNGSFAAERVVSLPPGASGIANIAVGDVNGDGRPDVVVVASGSGFNSAGAFVYYANADGSLQAPVLVDGGTQLGPLVVGDLDGDGRADIALAENGANLFITGTLRMYLGRSDGGFAPPRVLNPATYYTALAIGDINKDGKQDLIVGGAAADFQAQVSVLAGNGDGSFAAPRVFSLVDGIGTSISTLAVGDFSFDGYPDLLVGRDGEDTEFLLGDGSGQFRAERGLAIASAATYAVAADLNGDTVIDAVLAVGQAAIVPLLRTPQLKALAASPPASAPFTISASSTSGSVASGESARTTLSFARSSGFTETLTLSCSGLPANASCSFSPTSVDSGTTSSVLTIQTGAQALFIAAPGADSDRSATAPWRAGALAVFVTMLGATLSFARARRRRSSHARPVRDAAGRVGWRFTAVVATGALAAACGGGGDGGDVTPASPPTMFTPSGTYNAVVTATSASASQTLTYVLIVR